MGGVLDATNWQAYEALKRLANRTPVQCRQGEFRIANTQDHPVTAPFEIESWIYYREGSPFRDGQGNPITIQGITPTVICGNHRWLFTDTIPAKSEKSYYFDTECEIPPNTPQLAPSFEDGDAISRGANSVHASGRMQLEDNSFPMKLAVIPDDSDTWSHDMNVYGEPEGYFEITESTVSTGPIASILVARQKWGRSSAELVFRAYDQFPFIDLFMNIRWLEERKILKMIFEPTTPLDHVIAEIPQASLRKEKQNVEEPMHGWLMAGPLAILQDGAFAFDWNAQRLRLTLVRSSLYSYYSAHTIDPKGPLHHTDQGEHQFRLRLFPSSRLDAPSVNRLFADFIEPFRVLRQNC